MTDASYTVEKFTDLAASTLTGTGGNGARLLPDQSDTFFQMVFDRPGLLGDLRNVAMVSDTMNINKIGLGNMILQVAPSGTAPYIVDGAGETFSNDRNLPSANRFSPTFQQVQLTVKEYMAEIHLTDDVIENNLEQTQLVSTIMDMATRRLALDIENILINGDTTNNSQAAVFQLQDGLLKRIVTNVVDNQNATIGLDTFVSMQSALPTKYMNELGNMRYYLHNYKELAWRQQLASRGTSVGDSVLVNGGEVNALGVPMKVVAQMPQPNILFTDPKNIIVGMQRDMRLETERLPRSRMTAFIFSVKLGIQLEQEDATVKLINLG
jgi:HK97 family phage major capsid protein